MLALALLLSKMAPLYALMALGFLAGRFLGVRKELVARLLIYFVAPVVVFNSVLTAKLSPDKLAVPVIFLAVAVAISFIFWRISARFWKDSTRNLLAFSAGTGNTGYFGLPVAVAVFGESAQAVVMLAVAGMITYENTWGFYITARGNYSAKESLRRLAKLPAIYALAAALILNFSGVGIGFESLYSAVVAPFRTAYTALGMALIGLGLSGGRRALAGSFDGMFLALAFAAKFLAWPLALGGLVAFDRAFLGFLGADVARVLILLSAVPLAANTVAYATELKSRPEKAALAVLLSTAAALVSIPLVSMLLG